MPDQLLRCIPSSSNGATVLTLEGLLHGRTWRPLATIQPDVRVSARDTLNLDIFAPRLTWQTHSRTPSLLSLKGGNGGLRLSTIVSVHSHDMLRIETRLTVRRPVRLELARDLLHLADIPITRVWSPLQTPLPEMIVGDFAFHTPLAAIETPNACLAIIPNLRLLTSHRRVPTALSCDLPSRQFAYGCVPYHLLRDTYCVHYDTDSVELHGVLVYAYFLYFQNDCKPGTGLRRAVHRVWQLYAVTRALQAAPQRRPFEELRPPLTTAPIRSAHDAYAAALAAHRTKDPDTHNAAVQFIAALLDTPQHDGLFHLPAAYGPPGFPAWSRLADCSWTCYWLSRWHREIATHSRIIPFIESYATRLCTLQRHGGWFPAWVDPRTGRPARALPRSAETALHVILFTALHELAPDPRWVRAARRAANFLIREIISPHRWECTETFFHSSPAWKAKRPGKPDPRQGTFPAHLLALWSCAEALLSLYLRTKTPRYLSWGTRALDELALYQQIWDAPFLPIPTFGGFAASNTDIQWNCLAQALCAKTFLDYGRLTGLSEYFHRGIAALRAQYAVVEYAHPRTSEQSASLPLLPSQPVAHLPTAFSLVNPSKPDFELLSQPLWLLSPWTPLCAAESIWREYGDLYVDTRRVQAFGINGVVVERAQRDLAGIAIYGRELLGTARSLLIRSDTGQTLTLKVTPNAPFEFQL